MVEKVSLIIFSGGEGDSIPEKMVARAREAVALDTIAKARRIEGIGRIIVATASARFAQRLAALPIQVEQDTPGQPFHFGRRLQQLISDHHLGKPLYMGGGSGALLTERELRMTVEAVLSSRRILVTNNFHSTDFCAFSPGEAINCIEPPLYDNNLSWLLREKLDLSVVHLPRTLGTIVDVDTPADLLVLKLHPATPPQTRRYLEGLPLDTSRLECALHVFTSRDREALVAGRVSSNMWQYLERQTACRVRLISEERAMRASGRQARGEVRSLLGYHLQAVGAKQFFAELSQLADAAFLDSRVLMAHRGPLPKAADRFWSDLYRPKEIENPFLQEFTTEAMHASLPVVLGGHSLVSGGLCALVDTAWQRLDAQRAQSASKSEPIITAGASEGVG